MERGPQLQYWLMKAEPDSRIEKGKDVKFSVDDFESVKTTSWEGVRNYEARNLMRAMKKGDKVLFYHSNTKIPGIAGFAQVSKEAYPDYTSWDPTHPYYDPKTSASDRKWSMVDLTFTSRATHFVPLALLRWIADSDLESQKVVDYIGPGGIQAIKSMDLITRGRLSVQRVTDKAWDAIQALAENGGWEGVKLKGSGVNGKGKEKGKSKVAKGESKGKSKSSLKRKKKAEEEEEEEAEEFEDTDAPLGQQDDETKSVGENPKGLKRKVKELDSEAEAGLRRSTRARTKK